MAKAVELPSLEALSSILIADFGTGQLFWKKSGKEALNSLSSTGYRIGHIGPRLFRRSRVMWKMYTGLDPDEIDHINGVKTEDQIANLRDVSRAENLRNKAVYSNNHSKSPGLYFLKKTNKWRATIKHNGKKIYVGEFNTQAFAEIARASYARSLGFHPNHGRSAA